MALLIKGKFLPQTLGPELERVPGQKPEPELERLMPELAPVRWIWIVPVLQSARRWLWL
jgi:hypothetical protein